MSEESKALARRYLEVFAEGNFDVLAEILAPDYAEHDPASEGELRGHDGVHRHLEPYVNAFSDTPVAVDDQIAEGDRVVTRVTVAATHAEEFRGIAPTGDRIEIAATVFNGVAGGKFAEGWWNWDTLGLLQQLGATPAQHPAYPAM